MNYRTLVKGALALSLSLIVGSALASSTTYQDDQKYGATFENTAVATQNDFAYTVGDGITNVKYRVVSGVDEPYGWLSGDPEQDESKIIARTDAAGGQALQLNTDASTLTNKFDETLAGQLNTGIADAGAFFETEVKFVPSDTLDAGITGGQDATKFAIYAYVNENVEPNTTNLVVFHAYQDYEDESLADKGYIGYTNEVFDVDIDASVYTMLRVEMKKVTSSGSGTTYNVFSVKVGNETLTSDLAFDGDSWFLTVEDTEGNLNNANVSSLNFKGTGEIDNIKAGVIESTTTYAINWTAENATVTNAAGTVLTSTDTNFTAGATLTFTPATDMVITNVLVDGAAVAFDPASYTYTVGAADATVAVYAGTQASSEEFKAGDNVDGTITADQAAWLNSYIGTYTYAQLAALTAWQDKYLLNVDPFTGSGTLTVTSITVGNDVQVSIALTRTEGETAVTGKAIKGVLKLYGTADLGNDFSVLSTATVTDDDFSEGDTTTAAFSGGTAKFFKAVIESPAAE